LKLQDPQKAFPPFDVAAGMAQVLLRQGYIEIKTIVPPKPRAELKWFVREGERVDDYQYPPRLFHSCGVCGVKGMTESTQGTAHKSAKVYHCFERGLMCPPDVAERYVKAFATWKARSKKPPVPKISVASPAYQVRTVGLKTKQELIEDALTEKRSVSNV
jgi:hypothetical protein